MRLRFVFAYNGLHRSYLCCIALTLTLGGKGDCGIIACDMIHWIDLKEQERKTWSAFTVRFVKLQMGFVCKLFSDLFQKSSCNQPLVNVKETMLKSRNGKNGRQIMQSLFTYLHLICITLHVIAISTTNNMALVESDLLHYNSACMFLPFQENEHLFLC